MSDAVQRARRQRLQVKHDDAALVNQIVEHPIHEGRVDIRTETGDEGAGVERAVGGDRRQHVLAVAAALHHARLVTTSDLSTDA